MSTKFFIAIRALFALHISLVCAQSFEENTLEPYDDYCNGNAGNKCNDKNSIDGNVKVLYTTHYDILETEVNENFTLQNDSAKVMPNLSDPTEIYHSLRGNYIIYEAIGSLYVYPYDIKKRNNLGINKAHLLPNTLKPNSKLSIDWIHDLIYWIRDSRKIVVAKTTSLNEPIVVANKLNDFIRELAINPIHSFIIWCEFDNENNINILYKASQDGSNRRTIFETKAHMKRLVVDYRSKRIFYLSTHELCSIKYDGSDKRLVIPDSERIFQFDILGDYAFWIEYNSNHLYRANISQTQTERSLDLGHDINRFQIVHYWRQPNATNRCLNSNCSELCLPVDQNHFRCVCRHQNCSDSQNIQAVRDLSQKSVSYKQMNMTFSTTPQYSTSKTTALNRGKDVKNITSVASTTDSMNYRNEKNTTEPTGYKSKHTVNQNGTKDDIQLFSTQRTTSNNSLTGSTITDIDKNSDKQYYSTTKQKVTETFQNHFNDNTDKKLKFVPTTENSGQTLSNITESVILVDELKEYEETRISWYNLIMYGTAIFIVGIFMGTILSTLTIKLYGKQKWY